MVIKLNVPDNELAFLMNMQKAINADRPATETPLTLGAVALECIRMAMAKGVKDNESQ